MDIPEDSFISETLGNMEDVNVPSEFLPNVMFQVYERHHRNKLNWTIIGVTSLVLLLLTVGFFLMDVLDYRSTEQIGTFGRALELRMEQLGEVFGNGVATLGSVVTTAWEIISGAVGETSMVFLLLIGVGIVGLGWFLKNAIVRMLS